MRIITILFTCALFTVMLPYTVHGKTRKITVVYTNSLNGNLDYCNCPKSPKGGLVKRATEIKKIRRQYPNAVLVDTGDFFTCEEDSLLGTYLVKGYRHIGYDAIVPGDQELCGNIGPILKKSGTLPLICNNCLISDNPSVMRSLQRYVILKRGGTKIGVIGSISPSVFKFYQKSKTKGMRILNQVREIAADVVSCRKRGASIIILLSHSGYVEDQRLCTVIKGIDIIVGGHSQTLIRRPRKWGNTIIVQAGADGAHIGILELVLSGGKIGSFRNSFRLPDQNRPADDPYIRRLIKKYKNEAGEKYKNISF